MDQEGNFYTENYRGAKCQYRYICREGRQTYKTRLTFYGFRYIQVNEFPGEVLPDGTVKNVQPGSYVLFSK